MEFHSERGDTLSSAQLLEFVQTLEKSKARKEWEETFSFEVFEQFSKVCLTMP
jgi:hypothetical protein